MKSRQSARQQADETSERQLLHSISLAHFRCSRQAAPLWRCIPTDVTSWRASLPGRSPAAMAPGPRGGPSRDARNARAECEPEPRVDEGPRPAGARGWSDMGRVRSAAAVMGGGKGAAEKEQWCGECLSLCAAVIRASNGVIRSRRSRCFQFAPSSCPLSLLFSLLPSGTAARAARRASRFV